MKIAGLAQEDLKEQDHPLTEEQEAAIQENVFKQFKKGKEDDSEEEPDDSAPPKEDTQDGKDEKPDGDKSDSEDADGKDKAEEGADKSDKADKEDEAGKDKKEKTPEELAEETKKAEEDFKKQVSIYAEENSLNEDQAKLELEHIGKIQEKYAKDPIKMGKAILYLQGAYTRSQQSLKKITEAPQEGELVMGGKKLSKEESKIKLVEMYREAYPQITEDLDDEKVHGLALNEYKREYALFQERQAKEIKEKGSSKRQELLNSVKEEDKPFLKDIKAILDKTDERELLSEDFDFNDYLFWARGRSFHRVMKEREEAAYKRGLEQKKILGVKAGSGEEPKGANKSAKTVSLTEAEKERALSMYDGLKVSDEEKFKMYREVYPVK